MDHSTPQPLILSILPTEPEQGLVNHFSEASYGPVGAQGRLPQNVSQQHMDYFEFKSFKKHVVAKEEDGEGREWEFGVIRCNYLYIKWINNKVLLCSTGNYVHYPVRDHHGEEYEQEYILHN